MPCSDVVCGTGGWTGPLPGDPDNNVSLSAVGDYGGVKVSWSYPTTNAFAVAHTKLYRGISDSFALAVEHRIVSGSYFFDAIAEADIKQYYYWIKLVSVNGTEGDLIGYATATPLSLTAQTLDSLTGLIDEGVLAQSLRTRIGMLDILNRDLGTEIIDRIANNEALVATLAQVQSETGEALTYIANEVSARTSADEAMVTSLNAIAAGLAGNAAAIVEEKTVRVTELEALASDVSILYTDFAANTAAIIDEKTARTTKDEALTTALNILAAENDTFGAAIQSESQARVTGDSALANQITTAQTVLGNNIASVQTNMESKISTTDGKVTTIGALYTAKVDVNGLVGGFGIYNNGQVIDAGFDVDRFWIGRPGVKQKPFSVENGIVYINEAKVNTLSIQGNAVTVPISRAGGARSGAGYTTEGTMILLEAPIYLSAAGVIAVIATAGQSYANNVNISSRAYLEIYNATSGGGKISTAKVQPAIGGATQTSNIATSMSYSAPAGYYVVTLWWAGQTGISITSSDLLILGAKR